MYNRHSNPKLTNCTFSGNSAESGGGGMYRIHSGSTLTNCAFSRNTARYRGGGMLNNDTSPTLVNCILWHNDPDEFNNTDSSSTPTVSFSDIDGGLPRYTIDGGGNIDAPPLFVPGPGGCYYLSQTTAGQVEQSPCVAAGSTLAVNVCHEIDGDEVCMSELTTRSDENVDLGTVDMGYH